MKTRILIALLSLFALASLANPDLTLASEGTINLRNQVGGTAQCLANSVWISSQLNVEIICNDISYPAGSYVVWAQPKDGGNPIRLGDLAFGRVLLKTNKEFSGLFVTLEQTSRPRTPNNNVIMRGNVVPFEFDFPAGGSSLDSDQDIPNELIAGTPTPTPEPASNGGGLFRVLAIGGVLAFLALFGIILVVFVITRR